MSTMMDEEIKRWTAKRKSTPHFPPGSGNTGSDSSSGGGAAVTERRARATILKFKAIAVAWMLLAGTGVVWGGVGAAMSLIGGEPDFSNGVWLVISAVTLLAAISLFRGHVGALALLLPGSIIALVAGLGHSRMFGWSFLSVSLFVVGLGSLVTLLTVRGESAS